MKRAIQERAHRLGYHIKRGYYSPVTGKRHAYATVPYGASGTVCLHDTLTAAIERLEWAETVRGWQSE